MESSSKVRQWMNSVTDYFNEQGWFQELKTKWDELDPQSRMYLQLAAVVSFFLLIIILVLGSIISVQRTKSDTLQKQDLLSVIKNANDEMTRLKEGNSASADAAAGPWAPVFESIAVNSGIDKASVLLSDEKAGQSTDTMKESLFDVQLKKVNLRQVIRYSYQVENGSRPMKIRALSIDTKNSADGYMDALISISAFSVGSSK